MEKKVVLDFDRTLIPFDSILGFYKKSSANLFQYWLKRFPYLIVQVAYKCGLLDNATLKFCGFFLFLKGKDMVVLNDIAQEYAKYLEVAIDTHLIEKYRNDQCIILSGSYLIYLKYVNFPLFNYEVFGSTIEELNNRAVNVSNVFGSDKISILKNRLKWDYCDVSISDSLSDESILKIAKRGYLIDRKRNLIEYEGIDV